MELVEKIVAYKALGDQIQALEEERRALGKQILEEMPKKTIEVPGYRACRHSRLSIRVSLENARQFDAIKMVEEVDKEKIKALHKVGTTIEGVEEIAYLVVSAQREKTRNYSVAPEVFPA